MTVQQRKSRRNNDSVLHSAVKRIESSIRPLRDRLTNGRHTRGDQRFLVLRHPAALPSYYSKFLKWTADEFPELRRRFELRLITQSISDWTRYSLVVPWLPDTFMYRDGLARQQAADLVAQARTFDIPIINPPEQLTGTSKHDCAQRLRAAGINAPESIRIVEPISFRETTAGMQMPFLIREDLAHGGWSPVYKIETHKDLQNVPLEQMESPIAVRFIDTRSSDDGLVRKYRYMAMGDIGIAHTLQISDHWEVRSGARKMTAGTIAEERNYCSRPDPNHALFQAARRILKLDFLAFDYSYSPQGEVIVWEINVLPGLGLPTEPNRDHLIAPLERAMSATHKLLLQRAKMDIPEKLEERIRLPSTFQASTSKAA